MGSVSRNKPWRPVLAGVVVLALLVGVFSFAPSRAIARQLLAVFRVRKFAVVQISLDQAHMDQVGRALEDKLFVAPPEAVVDEPAITVASIEEARQKAGFGVRVPRLVSSWSRISVKGRTEYAFKFNRESLVTLLQLAEMDPNLVPVGLTEGVVRVSALAMVEMTDGQIQLIQVLNPSVEYPEGINPRIIGEAGLRILGLTPKDAKRIAERLDWANTLILPIPVDVAEFQELTIAGGQAVLITPRRTPNTGLLMRGLIWEKDGVVYMLSTPLSGERMVQIAESMF